MAGFRLLYLTSFFILFSQTSGQWSGNATIKQCGSSDLTIAFNFSLGSETFYRRSWYLNSFANRIADVNRTGFLTVEPPYISRLTLSGTSGITLSHANSSDSGSYLFIIVTDASFNLMTATTTVIINEKPNNSCIPITTNYINSITCKIPAACPGKDSIQARWNDGSIAWLRCPSAITKYTCCAVGDPVTNCYNGSLCTETECKDGSDPGSIHLTPNRTSHELTESSSLTVNCSADCFPDCQYKWTGPGGNIVSSTGLLSFISIGRNQSGQYTCTASDSDIPSKRATAVISVTVFYGPDDKNVSLSPSNTSYQLIELSHLDVKCSATCEPQCDYQWSGPGLVSQNNSMGLLSISKIQRNQNGIFLCTATNPKFPGKSATVNVSVIVYYGPDIPYLSPSTTVYTKLEGESVPDINCSADCFPGCTQVWMRGIEVVQESNGKTLSLRQVTREKTGDYVCWCNNTESRATGNISIKLIVQYPPVLTMKATNTSKGGRVVINCTASGVPDNYTFYKLTHKAPDVSRTIVRELELTRVSNSDVSFTIEGATYQDTGFYVCKASNGITHYSSGQLVMEDMVSVWIKDQPVITSNTRYFVSEKGKSGQMYIEFYPGISQPLVTWYIDKNGTMEPLQNSSNFGMNRSAVTVEVKYYQKTVLLPGYNASLEVFDVAESQFTSYKVEINNGWAEPAFVILELKPRGPPETPYNLSVVPDSVTIHSIQLSWRAGFHGGASQTFVIEYREAGKIIWLNKEEPRGLVQYITLNATITDLKDGTKYEFRIYSENVYDRSQISSIINETTKIGPSTYESPESSVAGIAGGISAGLVIILVGIGIVLVLWKRNQHKKHDTDNDVTREHGERRRSSPIKANSDKQDAAIGSDYEGLHFKGAEANQYLQLTGITMEENRNIKIRSPESDSYEKLQPYANSDIQMYSSLKIPKTSKDSVKYENTWKKTPDTNDEIQNPNLGDINIDGI